MSDFIKVNQEYIDYLTKDANEIQIKDYIEVLKNRIKKNDNLYASDRMETEFNMIVVDELEKFLDYKKEEMERKKKEVHQTTIGRFSLNVKHDRFIIVCGNDIHVTDLQLAKKQLQEVIDRINESIQ